MMDYIEDLIRVEKGKLEIDFDMQKLNFYAVIRDEYRDAVVNAEGETLEDLICNLNGACEEYLINMHGM